MCTYNPWSLFGSFNWIEASQAGAIPGRKKPGILAGHALPVLQSTFQLDLSLLDIVLQQQE
jgi:hypothetical protein